MLPQAVPLGQLKLAGVGMAGWVQGVINALFHEGEVSAASKEVAVCILKKSKLDPLAYSY